jgi:hypothetical protein
MQTTNDGQAQQIVDGISRVAKEQIGTMSAAELSGGWDRLERSLSGGSSPSIPIVAVAPSWWLRGLALAAVGLVVGFSTFRLWPSRSASPLHYALEGAALGPGETVQAGTAPAQLTFSDQSRVRLAPSGRLAVSSVDARGAHIALADGSLDVSVQHRKNTSWRFDAGPFWVHVTGTSFHLAFDAQRGHLFLRMVSGTVEVRGPADDRVFTLRGGESLELFTGTAPKPAATASTESPSSEKGVDGEQDPSPKTAPPANAPTGVHGGRNFSRRRAHSEEHVEIQPPPSWSKLVAQGEFSAVVRDAERRGLDATLASAQPEDLTSLADAARYTRRNDLARKALLGLRARFPGTDRARDAAFFLGRLAEEPFSSASAAVAWYETYLNESARGPYAGEALGRELSMLARTDRLRARRLARVYVERFPNGPQAELAKSLVESVP